MLDNLARALQLDEARILDGMEGVPAHIRNGRFESLAVNRLGRALFAPVYEGRELPVSHARFVFLDPRAEAFYGDWERTANDVVAALRSPGRP